jgi:hypothetical protein
MVILVVATCLLSDSQMFDSSNLELKVDNIEMFEHIQQYIISGDLNASFQPLYQDVKICDLAL